MTATYFHSSWARAQEMRRNLSLYSLNYSRKLGDMLSYGPHIRVPHFREYTAQSILLYMAVYSVWS